MTFSDVFDHFILIFNEKRQHNFGQKLESLTIVGKYVHITHLCYIEWKSHNSNEMDLFVRSNELFSDKVG